MELRFMNTREEYLEAHAAAHFQGVGGFVMKTLGAFIGFLFLIASLKLLLKTFPLVRTGHLFLLIAPVGYLLLGLLCVWPLTGRWGSWLLPIGRKGLRETRVAAGQDTIEFSRGAAKRQFRWNQFTRFQETSNVFLLFFTSGSYQVITKRAFAAGEEEEFRKLISVKQCQ